MTRSTLSASGSIPTDGAVRLGREIDLAPDDGQAVRPAEGPEVGPSQLLPARHVDHRQRLAGNRLRPVVRDEGQAPIRGRSDLVRARPGLDVRPNLAGRRVDDDQPTPGHVHDEEGSPRFRDAGDRLLSPDVMDGHAGGRQCGADGDQTADLSALELS